MRGRKPKPTALKKLAGNPGHRRLNAHEARIPASLPSCPTHLSREAKTEWRRVVPLLFEYGLMTAVDRGPFAVCCQAWARWVKAEQQVNKRGMTSLSAHGTEMVSPYVRIARAAYMDYVKVAAEFGMTPASRSRATALGAEQMSLADQLFHEMGRSK
jgi:P27 family predicted phage terminase small subunit